MKDFVLQEHKESQCTFAFIKTYHVAIEVHKTNSPFFFLFHLKYQIISIFPKSKFYSDKYVPLYGILYLSQIILN